MANVSKGVGKDEVAQITSADTVRVPVFLADDTDPTAGATSVTFDAAGMTVGVCKFGASAFTTFPTFDTNNWDEIGYGWYDVIIRGSDAGELALLDTLGDWKLYVKATATKAANVLRRVVSHDALRQSVSGSVSIPPRIDLSDTKVWRLGIYLSSADGLPTTGEITPGTVTIKRSAAGAAAWSTIVDAAACSEAAGVIYYDEVFDSATGYAAGDAIQVTFAGQQVTIGADTFDLFPAGGIDCVTYIDVIPAVAGDEMDLIGAPNATAVTAIQAGLATSAHVTAIEGATFDTATHSLEAIRNRGDAAWTGTATGGDRLPQTKKYTLGAGVLVGSVCIEDADTAALSDGTTPVIGICTTTYGGDSGQGVIQWRGVTSDVFAALDVGTTYYAVAGGGVTATPGAADQELGVAVSPQSIDLQLGWDI